MPKPDFSRVKLGRSNIVVQIHETMMNFKVKGHLGRYPLTELMLYALLKSVRGLPEPLQR